MSSEYDPAMGGCDWSARVFRRIVCVKWHPHECQDLGFPQKNIALLQDDQGYSLSPSMALIVVYQCITLIKSKGKYSIKYV